MPYRLRKVPNKDLYWVIGEDGKHHSKEGLPKERAMAQMSALYIVWRKEKELKGGSHQTRIAGVPLKTYYEAAKASYAIKNHHHPPKHIGDAFLRFTLVHSTRTLVFYVHEGGRRPKVLVGIRGTDSSDSKDLGADALIGVNSLTTSDRYKHDLETMKKMYKDYPHEDGYYWIGAGHSLGGAILDHFIKEGYIKTGVSYNPAVEKPFYNSSLNHRIYNEHDPLYWFMGSYAKVYDVRKDTRPSDWVDYLSWISPWWKVGYTALSAHRLSNFEGGMRGGLTNEDEERIKLYAQETAPENLYEPDMKFAVELEDDEKENDALYTSLMGAGEWNCPDALPIRFRPDGTRQFTQETCDVVNGVFDIVTGKCAKKGTNPVEFYDNTCKSTSKEYGLKEQQETEQRKRTCSGTDRAEPPYVGTPARDVGDPSVPREYIDNDLRIYTPEDCNYLKGVFHPFETTATSKYPLWVAGTNVVTARVTHGKFRGESFLGIGGGVKNLDTIVESGYPLLVKEVPESHYNPGAIRWYDDRKWKAVSPKSYKPGTNDHWVGLIDVPDPSENGTYINITQPDVGYAGWWPVEEFYIKYSNNPVTSQENKSRSKKLEAYVPWADGQSYDYGKRVYTITQLDKPNEFEGIDSNADHVNGVNLSASDVKWRYGTYKLWICINQENIPPTQGGWEDITTEAEKKYMKAEEEDPDKPYDMWLTYLWRKPIEKSYTESLEYILKSQWGDCVVNGKEMNRYCAPLNSEYADVPVPDVGKRFFPPDVDKDLNNPSLTYSEAEFDSTRADIKRQLDEKQAQVGTVVKEWDEGWGEEKAEWVEYTKTQDMIDYDKRMIIYSNGTKKPPLSKPIYEWFDYREFLDAARDYWKANTTQLGEYSETQLKELGDYSKKVNKCPESLKWNYGKPYTDNDRLCFQTKDPKNPGWGIIREISTYGHAMGFDKKSKCYLPEKPNGTYGVDIAKDERGKYVMATPDQCYARQMAMFKEVADSDWWPGDKKNAGITQLWRRYASQAYDKYSGQFAGWISKSIQDQVKKAVTPNVEDYLPEWWTEKKKKEQERLDQMEKDVSNIFGKKFGIPKEKRDKFWNDYFEAALAGKTDKDFFKQYGSFYTSEVYDNLIADVERTKKERLAKVEAEAKARGETQDRIDQLNRQAIQDMFSDHSTNNPIRRDAERSAANLPNLPQSLPPSPRDSNASEGDLPDPRYVPGTPEFEEEMRKAQERLDGLGYLRGGDTAFPTDEPLSKQDFIDGLWPITGEFWTSPESFVHKINEKLGLTGESDVEKFARLHPKAPAQEDPIKQGMAQSIQEDLQKDEDWNTRAKTLLKRREYVQDNFPLKNEEQLGYKPIGNQFANMGSFPYDETTGIRPPPGAVPTQRGSGKGKAKTAFVRYLESEEVVPAKYLAEAQKKAKKAGLDWKCLTWATDGKHKLEVPHEGKVVRFGAAGMGDHIFYKLAGDPTADSHRKAYRARATKIKGDWASNKYSPNSLALAVLW